MTPSRQLLSAGAVVVRRGPQGKRVLILHHADFDEWRLPKGKLKVGESAADAAQREVAEEAGLHLPTRELLGTTCYLYEDSRRDEQVSKIVFFFAMQADESACVQLEEPTFDAFEWATPPDALRLLHWPNEADIVARATAVG